MVNLSKRFAEISGRSELTADDLRQHACVGVAAIRNRFGTLKKAFRAAGLLETALGRRYTDEDCSENLLLVWTHLGRPPRYQEMKTPPSIVGPKAYIGRWKTWNRALHAFVERANSDKEPPDIARIPSAAQVGPKQMATREDEEDGCRIRLGLRYKVLVRDRFKCVLCGNTPALDPMCRLHVDHIVAWSRGGKTVEQNLRALCEKCNLGKGNAVE